MQSLPRLALTIVLLLAGCAAKSPEASPAPCSPEWVEMMESKLTTGDNQGHGPDPGSIEWRSAIEFKLGIRGNADVPDRLSPEWCTFIDAFVNKDRNESGR